MTTENRGERPRRGRAAPDEQAQEVRSIEQARRFVADRFEARLDPLVDEACATLRRQLPEFAELASADTWDNIWRVTYFTRQLQAAAVRGGRVPDAIPHDAEIGRLGFVTGMSHETVIRSYQLGGGLAWQGFVAATHELDVSPELRAECVREVADLVRRYEEQLVATASEAYQEEQARRAGRGEAATYRHVRRILDGVSDDVAGINYPVGGTHLGMIAYGPAAEQAAAMVRTTFSGERLAVRPNDHRRIGSIWLWHALTSGYTRKSIDAQLAEIELPADAGLAVGEPTEGIDGFRATHRQASGAYVIAQRTGQPMARYRDVCIELIAVSDEDAASLMAACELAGLEGDDATTVKFRQTLLAYFESGQNAASTAARLGVNDQTVARRLRAIRERIGCYPQDRRAELELALRYRRLLERSAGDRRGVALGPVPAGVPDPDRTAPSTGVEKDAPADPEG